MSAQTRKIWWKWMTLKTLTKRERNYVYGNLPWRLGGIAILVAVAASTIGIGYLMLSG